jgi:DNA excision repair protein ERCC-2
MAEKRFLSLSVHGLVDFLLRKGDIDSRIYNQETMQMGTILHAAFQEKQGHEYLSEYALKETFERPEGVIALEGRADGIIVGGDFPIIDEIKSTVIPLEDFYHEQKDWHFGQAECYALMYLHETKGEKCAIRLTYLSQTSTEKKTVERLYDLPSLEKDVDGLMDEYLAFFTKQFAHEEARNHSAKSLAFPFGGFRKGQREMAKYVYAVAKNGGTFYCEAPTGIGKTISALYPAIKAFASTDNKKIFYLTAKTSGRLSAYDALTALYEKGFLGRDSLLIAKDKICFSPGAACNPDECPFAKGYYDKIKKAMEEACEAGYRFDEEHVVGLAKKYAMCPFELQLDLSLWSDIIIGDYNYFFDPLVHLERYFDPEVDSSKYLVLIDEAHNLVERGRDMYSAELSAESFSRAKKALRSLKEPKIKTAIGKVEKLLRDYDLASKGPITDFAGVPPELKKLLDAFSKKGQELQKKEHPKLPDAYKDISREAHRFSFLSENFPQEETLYGEREKTDYVLHLACLDPSPMLSSSLKIVKGRVLFSATLSPMNYYQDAISGNHEDPYLLLPSPFPKENFDLLLAPMVSTRYKDRSKTYSEVARYLARFVAGKLGNYFLYFPSYEYLENIQPFLNFPNANVFTQEKEMSDEEKSLFLSRFLSHPEKTTIGLLIIGGSFSEGIDLVEDRLIGVAVVGIGLPQLSHEKDLLRDYFAKKNGEGYEYAYMNPGMNKVMQAVGRLIRSEKDRGAALLIDDRYLHNEYRDLFARLWTSYDVVTSPEDVEKNLRDFYSYKIKD